MREALGYKVKSVSDHSHKELSASEGLQRDREVIATGSGIKVPVGDKTLGRLFNVLGDTVTVELFNDANFVDVVGTSKGKGFQGVVKRHGFGGVGQTTHGQHNRARKPGSIGACSYPAKVFKGMRMGGQLGGDRVTVQSRYLRKIQCPCVGYSRAGHHGY